MGGEEEEVVGGWWAWLLLWWWGVCVCSLCGFDCDVCGNWDCEMIEMIEMIDDSGEKRNEDENRGDFILPP